jgi:hypothetical protein
MRRNGFTAVLMVLVALSLLGFGVWARVAGPCSLWSWAPAKEVPARCFMEGK